MPTVLCDKIHLKMPFLLDLSNEVTAYKTELSSNCQVIQCEPFMQEIKHYVKLKPIFYEITDT